MQTLIIDHKGSSLSLRDGRIRIALPDAARPQHVPLPMVERVVVTAAVDLHSSLLAALSEAGIPLLILSPRDHRRTAIVTRPTAATTRSGWRSTKPPAIPRSAPGSLPFWCG